MSLHLYAGFVLVSVVLILIPGPNVALIVAYSLAHGRRYGLTTVAGTASAMIVQLGLTLIGMATMLGGLANGLAALRWTGVAYLVHLGVKAWRAPAVGLTTAPEHARSPRRSSCCSASRFCRSRSFLIAAGRCWPQGLAPPLRATGAGETG